MWTKEAYECACIPAHPTLGQTAHLMLRGARHLKHGPVAGHKLGHGCTVSVVCVGNVVVAMQVSAMPRPPPPTHPHTHTHARARPFPPYAV